MGNFNKENAMVHVIASSKNWIEGDAIRQLENTSKLEGIKHAVGLPDLHPGKEHPIGAAFISKGWIYPQLVGGDIGCGIGLWQTELTVQKIKLDKWLTRLNGLDDTWDGDAAAWLQDRNILPTTFDHTLGTIGGGNHFAELQKIELVIDKDAFDALNLDFKSLYLLVHSGSRGLGESILQAHQEIHGRQGLHEDTPEARQYISKHDHALRWAEANRHLIVHRFLTCLQTQGRCLLDVNHTTVLKQKIQSEHYWLHRKGATPATEGAVVIPGSRGHVSYLVQPVGPQKINAYSLAHGAGRKWTRTDAKGKLAKYRAYDFLKTPLGSRVICEDKDLIFEEAPQAYKNIETVVGDLVDTGLIKIIALLCPMITYKTRRHKQ